MFLCERCHPKTCRMGDFHSRSYGPCEGCRRTSNCVDCHDRSPIQAWHAPRKPKPGTKRPTKPKPGVKRPSRRLPGTKPAGRPGRRSPG